MINLLAFSERLSELIFETNKNVDEIAKSVGVHKSAIYRYLRGERLPGMDVVIKLADLFHCSIDFLMALTDTYYPTPFGKSAPFGERLAFLLERFSVTKYKLVKDTGIPESIVYSWQNGQSVPTLESLIKLSDYFDCTIDYLIGRDI